MGSISFFCVWISCCPSNICWKHSFLPHIIILPPIWKSIGCKCESFFWWTCNSIPLIYLTRLMLNPHCPDCWSFLVRFETGKNESSNFNLPFKDSFGYPWILEFPWEFWEQLIYFCQEVSWDFAGDRIESIDQFGASCQINNI